MRIGELARRTGLSSSRIRFYEGVGLLRAVDRQANGYRSYPPEAPLVLELIAGAQKAGFTLDEIRSLLPSGLDGWDHDALLQTLRGKVSDIEALQSRLARSKASLLLVIEEIETRPDDVDCVTNAKRLLVRLMERDIAPATLRTTDVRLLDAEDRRQAVQGPK